MLMTLVDGTQTTQQNSVLLSFPDIIPRVGLTFSLNELRRIRAITVEQMGQGPKDGKPRPDAHYVRVDFDTPTEQQKSSGAEWHYYRTRNLGTAKNAHRVHRIFCKRIAKFVFQNQRNG